MSECILHEGISERAPLNRERWEKVHGPIPEGKNVCHSCDNPRCKNVEHFFLGSQKENIQDCIDKERFVFPPGGWNKGKNTPDEVKEKQSLSQKGIPRGPMPVEHRKAIGEGQLGSKRGSYSVEHRKSISEGIKKSADRKRKEKQDMLDRVKELNKK